MKMRSLRKRMKEGSLQVEKVVLKDVWRKLPTDKCEDKGIGAVETYQPKWC